MPLGSGTSVGPIYLEYWGNAIGTNGSVNMWLMIDTPAGRFSYKASGVLAASVMDEQGVFTYSYTAVYHLDSGPLSELEGPMPHDGQVDITVRYWADQTSLYAASVALHEN